MKEYNLSELDATQRALYDKMVAHYRAAEEYEKQLDESIAKWDNIESLQARIAELGKRNADAQPMGDYLNPIDYVDGMEAEQGKWYRVEDPADSENPFVWECIKSGVPQNGADTEYFDIPQA